MTGLSGLRTTATMHYVATAAAATLSGAIPYLAGGRVRVVVAGWWFDVVLCTARWRCWRWDSGVDLLLLLQLQLLLFLNRTLPLSVSGDLVLWSPLIYLLASTRPSHVEPVDISSRRRSVSSAARSECHGRPLPKRPTRKKDAAALPQHGCRLGKVNKKNK